MGIALFEFGLTSFICHFDVWGRTDLLRPEEGFRASEPLVANGDDLSVRELVALLNRRGSGSSLHLFIVVKSNVA